MQNKIINNIKTTWPALTGFLILLTAEIINFCGLVPPEKLNDFVNIMNILMILVALCGFFLLEFVPLFEDYEEGWQEIFANIAVPIMAFPMNIEVFGHTFHQRLLWENIWGWQIGWIILLAIQILLVLGVKLKEYPLKSFSNIEPQAEQSIIQKRHVIWYIIIGIFVWTLFLGVLSYNKGIVLILTDLVFWGKSILLGINYFLVASLINTISLFLKKKYKENIGAKNKNILFFLLSVIVLTAINMWPFLLGILTIIISISKIILILPSFDNKNIYSVRFVLIYLKGVLFILLCFVIIPFAILFLITFYATDGGNLLAQNPTDINSWLNFMDKVVETSGMLINAF